MSTLKDKTVKGFFWNFLETGSSQLIALISTMILARLLVPADFGLIGMTTIFVSLGQVLVDSGFSQALIRKQECTDRDYSTVLWINISISWILYVLIFISAPWVAQYFQEPRLVLILRLLTLVLPLNAMNVIQRTILTKSLDFKQQAIITASSVTVGLVVAIIMAMQGMGVWALVGKALATQVVMALLFWTLNKWRPKAIFSWQSFHELFSFGSKLLMVYSLATVSKNIYNVVIGKKYNATELGYYTNADLMACMPVSLLTILCNRVLFPVLSPIQNDNESLRRMLRQILRPMLLIAFMMMFLFVAMADSIVSIFLGAQWLHIIPYFQILCVGYSAAVLHSVNQIIMNVKGRSDYFLRTEVIKYILIIPVIIIGIYGGIYVLIVGYAIFYWIGFLLNGFYSFRLVGYGVKAQLIDALPIILFSAIIAIITYFFGWLLPNWNAFIILILQLLVALICFVVLGRSTKLHAYYQLKELIYEYLNRVRLKE